MRVCELIDILRDQDPESEVELAVVAPVDDDSDDITVDRYTVEGVLPWEPTRPPRSDEGVTCGWSAARTTTSRRSSTRSSRTTTTKATTTTSTHTRRPSPEH